jgi:lipid A 4'-phosphatase
MLGGLSARTGVAFVAALAVFLVWPEIDLWFSGLFHDGAHFPLADVEALQMPRHLIWSASNVTALGALTLWAAWLGLGRAARVPARLWGWVAAVYVVGPGLLVNVILKEEWGRARPAYVFAGEAEFTAPFVIADQCARNCSFVSGEGSAAVALAIVWGALLWPRGPGAERRCLVVALAMVAGLASALRILTGRHFLSDLVFAAFLVAFVAMGLWHLMTVGPAREALTLPALRADLREVGKRCSRTWRRLFV